MSKNTVPSEPLDPVGQIVGYARVSTADQNLDRQTDQLTTAGARRIFTDTITGSTRDRPGLEATLSYLRAGDTLTCERVCYMARFLDRYMSSRRQGCGTPSTPDRRTSAVNRR